MIKETIGSYAEYSSGGGKRYVLRAFMHPNGLYDAWVEDANKDFEMVPRSERTGLMSLKSAQEAAGGIVCAMLGSPDLEFQWVSTVARCESV
jgi:hypothetical protein